MVTASARYSASVDEHDTLGSLLEFKEISESPNFVVEFLVSMHEPQWASVNACNDR